MFIGMNDLTPSWRKLFEFIFVYSVLGRQGMPEPVLPHELKKMIYRFNKGEFDAPKHHRDMVTGREFEVGDMVITDDGLIEARVEEIVIGHDKTVVHLHSPIFGRETRLTISADRLFKSQ